MEKLPLDRARWPFIALLSSAVMLAIAHGFERIGGYMPCALCYTQRQIYWIAGALALFAVAVNWRGARPWMMSALCVAIGGVFLTGTGIAGYHSLVEWGVLPAPDTCTATANFNISSDPLGQLERPFHPPSCGEAAWRDPVTTLSMAGWNTIISMILAALSLLSAMRPMRADTANERGTFGEAA
jgi:disulfide bond formation protein DsbB